MFLFSFAIRMERSFASNPKPFSNCWLATKINWVVTEGLIKLAALDVDARVLLIAAEKDSACMKPLGILKVSAYLRCAYSAGKR